MTTLSKAQRDAFAELAAKSTTADPTKLGAAIFDLLGAYSVADMLCRSQTKALLATAKAIHAMRAAYDKIPDDSIAHASIGDGWSDYIKACSELLEVAGSMNTSGVDGDGMMTDAAFQDLRVELLDMLEMGNEILTHGLVCYKRDQITTIGRLIGNLFGELSAQMMITRVVIRGAHVKGD